MLAGKKTRRIVPIVASIMLATSGVAAITAGLAPATAWAEEVAAATQAETKYRVYVVLNDPAQGLSDGWFDVSLGQSIQDVFDANAVESELAGQVMFGDGSYHTFIGWDSSVNLDKPLEASDFYRYTYPDGTVFYDVAVTAQWTGASTIISASNATDIPANGKVDLECIDAWQAFCDSIGGTGSREYPVSVNRSTLNAAQRQAYDQHLARGGFEGLGTVDIAFDKYLSDGSDGTLDVARHDLATSDGVTFDLTFFELEGALGIDDLSDVYAMRLPDDGGEPETMTVTHDAAGNLVINDMTATGTYAFYTYKDVAEPWAPEGGLLPHTIENGIMTFPGHPELGEWYQLTVDAKEGITFDNPGGSSAWTMTIDAASLDEDDALFNPQPNSGIYFVRGDGQGMSTNLWIEWPADKALSYELASGAGTVSRVGGPNTLSINLSAPSTLKLRTATETVIWNEQGATLTHTVTNGDKGDDATWSMLTLVTEHLGGDAAQQAGNAVVSAVDGAGKMYVYDIYLKDWAGNEFAIPAGDRVTVTLPIPSELSLENLFVFHVADDGTVTDMHATVDADAGTVSFTTTHFSTFVITNAEGMKTAPAEGEPSDKLTATGDVAAYMAIAATISGAGLITVGIKRRK